MKTETEMPVKFFLRFQKVLNSIYTFFFEESVAEVIHDHRWLLLKENFTNVCLIKAYQFQIWQFYKY